MHKWGGEGKGAVFRKPTVWTGEEMGGTGAGWGTVLGSVPSGSQFGTLLEEAGLLVYQSSQDADSCLKHRSPIYPMVTVVTMPPTSVKPCRDHSVFLHLSLTISQEC